jgi:Fe-S-cluster-containing hydrogenase component 2/CRP-like cAMP-binding protein
MAQVQHDGLTGEWLSLDDLAALDLFKSGKRAFKVKLSGNFAPQAGQSEPGIKAAVRRHYQKGDVICKAGEYGSTAFVMLEGTASASLAGDAAARPIAGRTRRSMARLRDLFTRRRRRTAGEPEPADLGEVSAYATMRAARPPAPVVFGPGDLFGIDTCLNFYPRELTVRALEPCVVVEMLRSVLDTIREAGDAGAHIESEYRAAAVRAQLALTDWLQELREDERERLAAASELLTPEDDAVHDGVLYREGDTADAVYVVRAGSIKLAQQRGTGEIVFAYAGRGAAFGFEPVLDTRPPPPLQLVCIAPPGVFPPVALAGTATLGRKAGCAVVFPREQRAIGREHCRFEERGGELFLLDLDSINGTWLNGERIREAIVTEGDRVTVVDYTFEVRRPDVEATAAATPAPRLVTATGLDRFEVVQLPGALLRQLASSNPGFRAALLQIATAFATANAAAPEPAMLDELIGLNLYNSQNTLLIDLDRCTRCDECVRACADAHGGVARFTRDGPRVGHYLVTLACRSCTDPKCMIGCPVGSIRRDGSLEIRIEDWCIGCQRCANQCPFGNINMVELPVPAAAPAGAAVPLRATVCDLCAGYDGPSCVYACPHDAAIRVRPAAFLTAADLR